jgi:hypothetical protein
MYILREITNSRSEDSLFLPGIETHTFKNEPGTLCINSKRSLGIIGIDDFFPPSEILTNYETQRLGKWISFRPQVKRGDTYSVGPLRKS